VKCKIVKKTVSVKADELAIGMYNLSTSRQPSLTSLAVAIKKEQSTVELFYEKVHAECIKLKHFIGVFTPKLEISLANHEQSKKLSDLVHQHLSNAIKLRAYLNDLKDQMVRL
jgi:hypothetical protein